MRNTVAVNPQGVHQIGSTPVLITYTMKDTFEGKLWPLFLEPSAAGHSCYRLAWDPKPKEVRVYKWRGVTYSASIDERDSSAWSIARGDDLA